MAVQEFAGAVNLDRSTAPIAVYLVAFSLFGAVRITHPITGDEASNILLFGSDWRTLLLRTYPNNHALSTILGFILSHVLGYHITVFRLVSVASSLTLSIVLWIALSGRRHVLAAMVALTTVYVAPLFLPYSMLFRGYALQMALVFGAAAGLYGYLETRGIWQLLLAASLFGLALIHIPTTIYVALPGALTLFMMRHDREDIVSYLKVFVPVGIVVAAAYLVSTVLTGYAVSRPAEPTLSNLIASYRTTPLGLIGDGFERVFRHESLYGDIGIRGYLTTVWYQLRQISGFSLVVPASLVSSVVLYAPELRRRSLAAMAFVGFWLACALVQLAVHRPMVGRTMLIYLPFFGVVAGLVVERLVDRWASHVLARGLRLALVSVVCIAITAMVGWRFLTTGFSDYVDQVYVPSSDVLQEAVRRHCSDPAGLDGSGIIKQYLAYYFQQECGRRWSLAEIRAYIQERPPFPNASELVVEAGQAEPLQPGAVLEREGRWSIAYMDDFLTVMRRN